MNNSFRNSLTVGLLGTSFALVGCTQTEAPKPEPAPVAVVQPAPVAEAPKQAGDLMAAKASLEKAVGELKAKNYAGAIEQVTLAKNEVTAAAGNASLPAPVKATVESMGGNLDKLKALIEKKDPTAESMLTSTVASLGKLADMTKALGGMMGGATGAAAGAAGALGGMMKGAADATKNAAAGAADATKNAAAGAADATKNAATGAANMTKDAAKGAMEKVAPKQ